MDKRTFGKRLKELRNSKCITQAKLAEIVGVHEKQISKIESGAHYPTFENFIKILEALNVSISSFDDEDENLTPLKIKAFDIIKNSTEEEIACYTPILEHLQKCILNIKQEFYNKNF